MPAFMLLLFLLFFLYFVDGDIVFPVNKQKKL